MNEIRELTNWLTYFAVGASEKTYRALSGAEGEMSLFAKSMPSSRLLIQCIKRTGSVVSAVRSFDFLLLRQANFAYMM